MSARSLGALTLSMILELGGLERGLDRAELKSARTAAQIARDQKKRAQEVEQAWSNAGLAIGASLTAASAALSVWIRNSAKAINGFNDLKDATGSSVENISALDAIARQTGGAFEQVSSTLTKFNGVLKDADPSKGPGAVLKALNLDIEELKRLDPAEALRRTAVALQGFADDGAKARAVQELFGKSVKDVAPFLKNLAKAGELQAKVSTQGAEEIDRFNKEMAKTQAFAEDLARSLTINLVTSLNKIIDRFNTARDSGKSFWKAQSDSYWGWVKDFWGIKGEEAKRFQALIRPDDESLAETARLLRQAQLPSLVIPDPPKKDPKGDNSAAQKAAAQLMADLDAIRNARDQITNMLSNNERLLEAMRSAGLVNEHDYYRQKLEFLEKNNTAEEDALQKKIDRLRQERLSGKEQIDNLKKIADAESELARLRQNAATETLIHFIKQTDALEKIAAKFDAARDAAKGYVDAIRNQNERFLEGMGLGNTQREKDARLAVREDDFERQRNGLLGQLTNGQISQQDYDQLLSIQQEAHSAALASDLAYWAKKAELQSSFTLGAKEGLANYFEETRNVYEQAQKAVTDAFKGMEDALTSFVSTGKLDFKSLSDSIIADINRIIIRSNITGPLAEWINGGLKTVGGSGGFDLSSLFGFFAPGRANGGGVMAGGLYEINERSPEVLSMGGRQYLMMGNQGGTVVPQKGGNVSNISVNVPAQNDARSETALQYGMRVGRGIQIALDRNG